MRCDPRRALLALAIALAAAGCQGGTCIRHSDCPSDLVCGADNQCGAPPDAAWPDGATDAGIDGPLDATALVPPDLAVAEVGAARLRAVDAGADAAGAP